MKFVKTEDLRIGMRLAKPIYNNKGVLLYDRNSKLTQQGIESVRNFNLIGIYILEPAEPLPPMSEEDIEFEKFQMVSVFTVKDEMQSILTQGRQMKLRGFAETIIRNYGRLEHKINFIQNLRSKEDFVYKHCLNVAILVAMISHKMNMRSEEQIEVVIAAILHDIGKLKADKNLLGRSDLTYEEEAELKSCEYSGIAMIEDAFAAAPNIKRSVFQANRMLHAYESEEEPDGGKMVDGAKALVVAEIYDRLTAISLDDEPVSELSVLKLMMANQQYFDPVAVKALVDSINFLAEGVCVELSNGERALVVSSNPNNILRPMVLLFSTNTLIDLAQMMMYGDIEIVDVMKTLDNRYVMETVPNGDGE